MNHTNVINIKNIEIVHVGNGAPDATHHGYWQVNQRFLHHFTFLWDPHVRWVLSYYSWDGTLVEGKNTMNCLHPQVAKVELLQHVVAIPLACVQHHVLVNLDLGNILQHTTTVSGCFGPRYPVMWGGDVSLWHA